MILFFYYFLLFIGENIIREGWKRGIFDDRYWLRIEIALWVFIEFMFLF